MIRAAAALRSGDRIVLEVNAIGWQAQMSKGLPNRSKRARAEEKLKRQLEYNGATIKESHKTSHVSAGRGRSKR